MCADARPAFTNGRGCQFHGGRKVGGALAACGAETVPGRSYCAAHLWRIYQPDTKWGDMRRSRRQGETFEPQPGVSGWERIDSWRRREATE